MAPRKPNYNFERHERERLKAQKTAIKADAKREQRERDRAAANPSEDGAEAPPEDN